MKNIVAFTQGYSVPSSRFRISQYQALWAEHGVALSMLHAKTSAYPPVNQWKRPVWLLSELLHRTKQILRLTDIDTVILQRELISTLPTLERFIKKPIILDIDDAIFMHRKGFAARQLAKKADHIVCGNQFLAEYFAQFNRPITIIPTPVDTDRFSPLRSEELLLGWSGSSSGFKYLYAIEDALNLILKANPHWRLLIVADRPPSFSIVPPDRVLFERWSPETEVQSVQKMTIGIMPLEDSSWTRGKCSYKMLLYMACAMPVVVSDIGMNSQLLAESDIGLGVNSLEEWVDGIQRLIDNPNLRFAYGENGRQLVVDKYSLQACSAKWLTLLQQDFA